MNDQNIVRLDDGSRKLIEIINDMYSTLYGCDMDITIKSIINASLITQKEKLQYRLLKGNNPNQKNIFLLTDETKNMLQKLHEIQTRYAYKMWGTDELVPCEEALIKCAIEKELKKWEEITSKKDEQDD